MSTIGFADIHNHQFAHLGFGGRAFHGAPSGPIDQALSGCDFVRNPLPQPQMIHGPGAVNDLVGRVFQFVNKPVVQVLRLAAQFIVPAQ
jgi:hypothetical protein